LEQTEPLKVECEHFLECIREKKTPRSDGYSGLRVVSILEAICKSMKSGGASIPLSNGYKLEPGNQSVAAYDDLLRS
jgi:predicted dehydrogenase